MAFGIGYGELWVSTVSCSTFSFNGYETPKLRRPS